MKRITHWIIAAAMALGAGMAGAAEVVLGAGDVVRASVYGSPDLAIETRVSASGSMTFPLLGEVQVGGLSTQKAEKVIADLLEQRGYLKKAQVNLFVTTPASQQASVLGQVNRPGRYPVDGPRKVFDLLAMAGGVSLDGGDLVTWVRTRKGVTTRDTIDVVEMMRKGDFNQDMEVSAGDILYVERAPRVYITGEVQRAGPVRIERGMTVRQVLAVGGSLTARGTERRMTITRRGADGSYNTIDAKSDDLVQVDDVITIRESRF